MFRFAELHEAAAAYDNGDRVITIVASPQDGSLWYSDCVWRDATYAWDLRRHLKDGFWRLTTEIERQLPDDIYTFSPGENAVYIEVLA